MNEFIFQIEESIKSRTGTDVKLVHYALYFLLLSWVTIGIYPIILFFKRIKRVNNFKARKKKYFDGILEYTKTALREKGIYDEKLPLIRELESLISRYKIRMKPTSAGLYFFLSIITIGIFRFVVLYKHNKIWATLQIYEEKIYNIVNDLWLAAGIIKTPIRFRTDLSVRKHFGLGIFLSIITIGIYAIVWDYKIHTTPDRLYPEFHHCEDQVLQAVRTS